MKQGMIRKGLALLLCLSMLAGVVPVIPTALAAETACDHTGFVWTEISADSSLAPSAFAGGGCFRLTGDITLSGAIALTGDTDLHLDLNGHTVTTSGAFATLTGSSAEEVVHLTICDSSSGQTGAIDAEGKDVRMIHLANHAVLDIYGGTLTGVKGTQSNRGMISCNASVCTVNLYGGSISGNTNINGGGIWLNSGTFNLYGGSVSGNTATNVGGGVYVGGNASVLNVYGGEISDNYAVNGGGIAAVKGAVNLLGGDIKGNEAKTNGGAVHVNNAGTQMIMTGGSLQRNTAGSYGGAIHCANGSFTMKGGLISENTAANGGALSGENLFVEGGTISDNEAKSNGGAIFLVGNEGSRISGGILKGNHAGNNGSIVYTNGHADIPELRISGGTFTGNTAKGSSSFHMSGTRFVMSGGTISGNSTTAGAAQMIQFHNYQNTSYGTFTGRAVVKDGGIACSAASGTVAAPTLVLQRLKEGARICTKTALPYDETDYSIAFASENGMLCYTYNPEVPSEHASNWTKLSGEISTLEAGSYVLSDDLTLTETVTISGEVNLCLDNKVLTGKKAPYFVVPAGTSLTICDCSRDGYGTIDGSGLSGVTVNGAFAQVPGGSFTLNSGTITGFETTGYGGVFLANNDAAEIHLAGGAITDNTAGNGGVIRQNKGKLTISGATEISGNTATKVGSVILTYGSSESPVIEISGGTFRNNLSKTGGMFQCNGAKLTVTGGTFTENKSADSTFVLQATDLQMSGGTVMGNQNTAGTAVQTAMKLRNHYSTNEPTAAVFSGTTRILDGGVTILHEQSTAAVKELQSGALISSAAAVIVSAGDTTVKKVAGAGSAAYYLYAGTEVSGEHTDWKVLAGAADGITAGTYVLLEDVSITKTQTLTGNVTLCLNGHTFSGTAAPYFKVPNGKTLTICDCSEQGGGTMDGSTVKSSTATGLIHAYGTSATNGGTVILKSGTISGHITSGNGGALYLQHSSRFVMEGGTICGNQTTGSGGAMFANGKGTIELLGGTIRDNKANSGGALMLYNETVTMKDMVFTGNIATAGATIQLNAATTTMEDVQITENFGNKASVWANGATLTLTGGRIENNLKYDGKTVSLAMLVSCYNSNQAKPGSAVVTGNAVVGDAGVSCADASNIATIKQLQPGAMIKGDSLVRIGDDTVGTMGGWFLYAKDVPQQHNDYAPLRGTIKTLTAGSYCLMGDLYTAASIAIRDDVTLCLNGYKVTGVGAPYFTVASGGKLTICDHSENADGMLDGSVLKDSTGTGLVRLLSGGQFTLQSGGICGHTSTTHGPAVYISPGGTFYMEGGLIANNASAAGRGAVYIGGNETTKGQAMISGGTIRDNQMFYGGVFYINQSILRISGGSFIGNQSPNDGGVLYANGGDVVISGGEFTGNKSKERTIYLSGAMFEMSGGKVWDNLTAMGEKAVAVYLATNSALGESTGRISGSADIGDKGVGFAGTGTTCSIGDLDRKLARVVALRDLENEMDGTVYEAEDPETGLLMYVGSGTTPPHAGWTELTEDTLENLSGGTYYLLGDLELDDTVMITADTFLCLYGSQISGSAAPYFHVAEGASLTICDHSLLENGELNRCSGTAVTVDGSFILQSGGISGAQTAVEVTQTGSFALNGGFLSSNETAVFAEGTVTVSGGKVQSNEQGIVGTNTEITLSGGTFADNGQAVKTAAGTLTVSGGFYSGNGGEATLRAENTVVTVTGGTVRGNAGYALLMIGGSGTVSGGAVLEDLGVMVEGASLTIQKLTSGASVYAPTALDGLTVVEGDTMLTTLMENGLNCHSYKYEKATQHTGWKVLGGTVTSLPSGSYYLTENMNVGSGLTITGTVELCLGGKTITGSKAPYFTIAAGGSLMVCDHSAAASGGICGSALQESTGEGLVNIQAGGTFCLKGGAIYGHMTARNGAAVYNAGTFRMEGGRIHTNAAEKRGGAVASVGTQTQRAEITITGGTIENNTAETDGGAIFAQDTDITVTGGQILKNIAIAGRAAVAEESTFVMTGGTISDNVNGSENDIVQLLLSTNSTGMFLADAVIGGDKGVQLYKNSTAVVKELNDDAKVVSVQALSYDEQTVQMTRDLEYANFTFTKAYPTVNGVTITAADAEVEDGGFTLSTEWIKKSQQLTAALDEGITVSGKKFLWYSSNTEVATVAASGKVTYRAKGTTVITVKVLDEYDQDTGYYGSVTVTIGEEPLKILAIGNSSTRDALMYLSDLALLTGNRIELGIVMRSSASLRDHANYISINGDYSYYKTNADTGTMSLISDNGTKVTTVLAEEEWDAVILQHGQYTLGYRGTYTGDLQYLIDLLRDVEPGAKIYWNMGWALADNCKNDTFVDNYGSQAAMYNAIIRCTEEFIAGEASMFGSQLDGYIPTGAALEHMRGFGFEITRNAVDLSYEAGRLTAALTALRTLLPDADLSTITPSGLAGTLSEYDAALGKYAPDLYENTEEDLEIVMAAVEKAMTDATTGDLVPDQVDAPQWKYQNTDEGVLTLVQADAPEDMYFSDVATTKDGKTVYLTSYQAIEHSMTVAANRAMQCGVGQVQVWKGTDELNFDVHDPILEVNERSIKEWGLYPDLYNRYELVKGSSDKAQTSYVNADPRDPNLMVTYTDLDGDGVKEEVLLLTFWVRYSSNKGSAGNYINRLYLMHSADGGETWTVPQQLTGGVKRGDICFFEDGQILIPTYGNGAFASLMEWSPALQQWVLLRQTSIPDTCPEETGNSSSFNEVSFVSPGGDDTVYAFVRQSGVVLLSNDRGETWEEIANEPGVIEQPGFALLDEEHVFVTWAELPRPRTIWGKTFYLGTQWSDTPSNLIYSSQTSFGASHDAGDPSCALLADGSVLVVGYDGPYKAVMGVVVDPYAERFLPYEIAMSSSSVTVQEAELTGDALAGGETVELGEAMTESHTILIKAIFEDEAQTLTISTRNGEVTVSPTEVTYGEEEEPLSLMTDTETMIRISLVGGDTFVKVWQDETEPAEWSMTASGKQDGGATTLSGSGVIVTEAKIVCNVNLQMKDAVTAEARGALVDLGFSAEPMADQVVWTSSDPEIAVAADGLVGGLKPGTATITATVGDQSISCQVTVIKAPREIDPQYEREILMEDDYQKYEVGRNAFWEYHWANTGSSLYRFREKSEEDKPDTASYKIRQNEEELFLGLGGSTWHMTKQSFAGDYTVQFDYRFTAVASEDVNITLWQNDPNQSAYDVHAFLNMRYSGIRLQYRAVSLKTESDGEKNPMLYNESGDYTIGSGKVDVGDWGTIKIARTDGAMYIKVWTRGEEEPANWDAVLRHEVLDTDLTSFFRMQWTSSAGNTFDVDNLIISRATEVLAETPDEPEDPEIELFDGFLSRMVLGNALELQVGIPQNAMEDWTGTYAKVTFKDETTTIPYEEWTAVGPYYALTVSAAAKEMNEDVKVQIFNSDDQAVSVEYTDSIRKYAERNYEGARDEVRTMLVDMLNYGAAAQEYLGYNTDSLANEGLTQEQQAMATEAVECENGLVKGENYLGSRLMLQSRISLQLAFQNVDESCYAVYTYTDHYGKEQSVTVEGADFIDGYGVDIADISLADARQLVTCTVYDAEGEEVASVTDSVESYIARQSGDNALFDAIMKFATSAYNYFH